MSFPPVCFAATAKEIVNGVIPCVVISTINLACFPAAKADMNSMHLGSTSFVLPYELVLSSLLDCKLIKKKTFKINYSSSTNNVKLTEGNIGKKIFFTISYIYIYTHKLIIKTLNYI